MTHSREQGLETQVDASLGGISAVYQYHPNLQLSRIDYGNNMDALFDQGTNGMPRPQRIRYQRGNGTVLFDSGSFKYDPMQNVEQMRRSVSDRSTFKYDAAGRLLYGCIVQNGADAWQDYHYDPFDNMTESRTDDGEWNPDDYFRRSGLPKPGHQGHLMAGGLPYDQQYIAPHEIHGVVGGPVDTFNRRGRRSFTIH